MSGEEEVTVNDGPLGEQLKHVEDRGLPALSALVLGGRNNEQRDVTSSSKSSHGNRDSGDMDANGRTKPIVLIPLGGLGRRFSDVGHIVPKPLINVLGDPILYWLLRSLNVAMVQMVLMPYHPDLARYRFEDRLRKDFPEIPFQFVQLTGNTRGAADTLRIALEHLNDACLANDSPIISLDGDNFYTGDVDILSLWGGRDCLVTFEDFGDNPIYSYIRVEEGRIVEIKEKNKIGNLACTGAYGFSSWKRLLRYCLKTLSDKRYMQKNEFYTSSVIALMLQDTSIHFKPAVVPNESFICLGTPLQVRTFCNDFPRRDALSGEVKIKPRRYCFDLDNTLVTYPRVKGDYSTVEPIVQMIECVKYLKKFGHFIIIYTARRMVTHKGNISAVVADIGRVTFETLDKFKIPYDEICFGKPFADCYIDDAAVSAFADVEKALGFYQSEVKPRAFNSISRPSSVQLIRKESKDKSILEGEIYYYNRIPISVKDCFPIMLDFDGKNFSWYDLEKVNGTTASNLFVSEELTHNGLSAIMGTLQRIHNAEDFFESGNVDIYANYAKKLRKRYQDHSKLYSKFPHGGDLFAHLIKKLEDYEQEGCGRCVVVHGDPVMSNIILNTLGKIKLIDMRGRLGESLSIRGDETYDWAKLYQSLIGYDEILQGRFVTESYRQSMLTCFWKNLQLLSPKIIPEDVKLVTQSLLFSLLPLHIGENDEAKLQSYFSLIQRCK